MTFKVLLNYEINFTSKMHISVFLNKTCPMQCTGFETFTHRELCNQLDQVENFNLDRSLFRWLSPATAMTSTHSVTDSRGRRGCWTCSPRTVTSSPTASAMRRDKLTLSKWTRGQDRPQPYCVSISVKPSKGS